MQAFPGAAQIQSVSVLQSGEQPSPPVRVPVVAGLRGQVQPPVSARRDGTVEAGRRVAGRPPIDGRRQIGRRHVGADISAPLSGVVGADASRDAVASNVGDARAHRSRHHQ